MCFFSNGLFPAARLGTTKYAIMEKVIRCDPLTTSLLSSPSLSVDPHVFISNRATGARNRSQRLACRILRELAREPLLIYELLNAGVAEYLSRLLLKLREASIDRLLEVKETTRKQVLDAGLRSKKTPMWVALLCG